jgi:hypothetical protein
VFQKKYFGEFLDDFGRFSAQTLRAIYYCRLKRTQKAIKIYLPTTLLEGVSKQIFWRFFGAFEPIFDPKPEGNILLSILPSGFGVEKRPKSSKNSPKYFF